jgi:hypothetical protein
MTRIVSKLGIAAALTLGMLSTAAAQGTKTTTKKPVTTTTTKTTTTKTTTTAKPTTVVPVTKEAPGEVVTVHDTVRLFIHDTVPVYRRDTLRLTGPTTIHYDTTTVMTVPGWLDRGHGVYFGLGAGSYYPSGGLGGGQIPGYAFQANLGVDPAGSPLGIRLTTGLARPDEAQPTSGLGGRPSVVNSTLDLKLRVPFFSSTRFPNFGLYAVGGGAMVMYKDLVMEDENKVPQLADHKWHDSFGWNAGGGATLSLGHKRELFLEARAINFMKSGFENGHQLPLILGVNWY